MSRNHYKREAVIAGLLAERAREISRLFERATGVGDRAQMRRYLAELERIRARVAAIHERADERVRYLHRLRDSAGVN